MENIAPAHFMQPREISRRSLNMIYFQIVLDRIKDACIEALPQTDRESYSKFRIMKLRVGENVSLDVPSTQNLKILCQDKFERLEMIQQGSDPSIIYLIIVFKGYAHRRKIADSCHELCKMFISPYSRTNFNETSAVNAGLKSVMELRIWTTKVLNNDEGNVVFSYCEQVDQLNEQVIKMKAQSATNQQLHYLKEAFTKEFIIQFNSITTFGSQQTGTQMESLAQMSQLEFASYCLDHLPKQHMNVIASHAYDLTMESAAMRENQNYQLHSQTLTQPQTKNDLIRNILQANHQLHSSFMAQFYGKYSSNPQIPTVIHPHPLTAFTENMKKYIHKGVIELLPYSSEYLKNILMVCQWLDRLIFTPPHKIQRDYAVLCLYGTGGSGKSTINHCLMQAFNGYMYMFNAGEFQSPDMGYSSMIVMEETSIEKINTPTLKQIMDYPSSCKLQYKNAHPVDVTARCPVIMSTNDDLQEKLFSRRNNTESQRQSLDAVRQRLYPVKFTEVVKDEYLLAQLEENKPFNDCIKKMQEVDKIQLFNTLIGLTLITRQNFGEVQAPSELYKYFEYCLTNVLETAFGRLCYIRNKPQLGQQGIVSKMEEEYTNISKGKLDNNPELVKEIDRMKMQAINFLSAGLLPKDIQDRCAEIYCNSNERQHITFMMLSHEFRPYLKINLAYSIVQWPGMNQTKFPWEFPTEKPLLALVSPGIKSWYVSAQNVHIFELEDESPPRGVDHTGDLNLDAPLVRLEDVSKELFNENEERKFDKDNKPVPFTNELSRLPQTGEQIEASYFLNKPLVQVKVENQPKRVEIFGHEVTMPAKNDSSDSSVCIVSQESIKSFATQKLQIKKREQKRVEKQTLKNKQIDLSNPVAQEPMTQEPMNTPSKKSDRGSQESSQ